MSLLGLILAAGASRRMGQPKALLAHQPDGRSFVATLVDRFRTASIAEVAVVTRADADALHAHLAGIAPPPIVIVNPDPDRGQLSSLVTGIDAAEARGSDGVMVVPVDMPRISAATIAALADAVRDTTAPILRVVFHGRHGHPVVFRRSIFDAVRSADPAIGAKAVLRAHASLVLELEVDDDGVLRDVDRPEDYEQLFGIPIR